MDHFTFFAAAIAFLRRSCCADGDMRCCCLHVTTIFDFSQLMTAVASRQQTEGTRWPLAAKFNSYVQNNANFAFAHRTSMQTLAITARLVTHSRVGLCKLTSCRPATSLTAAQQWDHCQSPAINDSPLVINQRHWLPSITSSGAQCKPILDPTTWTMGARCARSGLKLLLAICVKTAARRRALLFGKQDI